VSQAFVDRRGLNVLVDMLIDSKQEALQREAAGAPQMQSSCRPRCSSVCLP